MPETITPNELQELLAVLRNRTALSRLNHPESDRVFEVIAELGYTIQAPAKANAALEGATLR